LSCVIMLGPHFVIFRRMRLVPLATLFPYTTLFRSDQTGHDAHDGCCFACSVLQTGAPVDNPEVAARPVERAPSRIAWLDFASDLDRKSTRLNSSHVKISYAVFCLKKKKKRFATIGN